MKITPAQGFKLRGNLNQISLSMSGYFRFVRKTLSLLLISSAAFFTPDIFGGGVIFSSSTPKDFHQSKFVRLRKDGTLLLRRPDLRGVKKIRVSPKKSYRVSCDILLLNGVVAEVRIGIVPYLKNIPANASGILPVKGTETELLRPCKPEDKVIYLKDCSKWQQLASCIAFDVDPDGLERDIPNFDLLKGQAVKWTRSGDGWEVTMNQAVQSALEKGVCVRQHIYSDPAILSPVKKVSSAWQTIDFVIGPGIAAGAADTNKLFKGVTHAAFMLKCPAQVLVKNVKIEEVK